ncbi:MFS transporter [Actinomadura rayongensis]|uniref:MFS transporter n=1 Tax=Actinomadura rayongensis TaxID=1429076 RepID=A0A6I4WG39_9ACTN|nr:MFS transporter [Actinomadura rayongensis]MXQ67913.1 MFS transporter [Actinomadura rayongensis]
MRELLRLDGFRRLLAGQAVSSLGDWMGTLALMYFVLKLSGSTTAIGGVLVLRLFPSAIGAPLAARAVTRWNRRRVMMAADVIRAGMAVLLPIVPWLGWVFFWAFAMEVASLAFLPARDSSVPVLIGEKDDPDHPAAGRLALANGLVMGFYYVMVPLGAAAFGLIHLISGSAAWTGHLEYVAVFWVDAATYVVSFFAIRSLPDLGPDPAAVRAAEQEAAKDGRSTRQGLLAAMRIPIVREILLAVGIVALGLGSLFSLGVVFVREVLHAGPLGFGALVALFGIGFVVGLALLRRRTDANLPAQMRIGIAGQGLVIIAMGLFASLIWGYLAALLFGMAATTALVSAITHLQDGLTGNVRDVALAAFHGTLRFGLAVAALITGAVADALKGGEYHLGPLGAVDPIQLVLIGSGGVALLGSFFIRSHPDDAVPASGPDDGPKAS